MVNENDEEQYERPEKSEDGEFAEIEAKENLVGIDEVKEAGDSAQNHENAHLNKIMA